MAIPAEHPARPGRDEQRRPTRGPAATREALLRAASEQFAVAGYEGASVTRILVSAGVTKGALYYHFASKRDIAEAVIETSIERKRTLGHAAFLAAPDPLSGLVAAVGLGLQLTLSDPLVHGGDRLLDDPQVSADLAKANYRNATERVRIMVQAAADAGLLRADVPVGLIVSTIVALGTGHRLISERIGEPDLLPARLAEMWRGLLPQIATDDWLRRRLSTLP